MRSTMSISADEECELLEDPGTVRSKIKQTEASEDFEPDCLSIPCRVCWMCLSRKRQHFEDRLCARCLLAAKGGNGSTILHWYRSQIVREGPLRRKLIHHTYLPGSSASPKTFIVVTRTLRSAPIRSARMSH
jgi:hypothetical protein